MYPITTERQPSNLKWRQGIISCFLLIGFMSMSINTHAASSQVVTDTKTLTIPLQMKSPHLEGELVSIKYKALSDTRKSPYLVQVIMGDIAPPLSANNHQTNELADTTIGMIAHYFPLKINQTGEVILRLKPIHPEGSAVIKLSFKMIPIHPEGHLENAAIEITSVQVISQ